MVLNEDESVYIATNNQLNPDSQSVLYHRQAYKIVMLNPESTELRQQYLTLDDYQHHRYALTTARGSQPHLMGSVSFGVPAPNSRTLETAPGREEVKPALLYYSYQSEDPQQQPYLVAHLRLTPKIFEYLMALSCGLESISFSQECHDEIITFKTSIDADITKHRTYQAKQRYSPEENLSDFLTPTGLARARSYDHQAHNAPKILSVPPGATLSTTSPGKSATATTRQMDDILFCALNDEGAFI